MPTPQQGATTCPPTKPDTPVMTIVSRGAPLVLHAAQPQHVPDRQDKTTEIEHPRPIVQDLRVEGDIGSSRVRISSVNLYHACLFRHRPAHVAFSPHRDQIVLIAKRGCGQFK